MPDANKRVTHDVNSCIISFTCRGFGGNSELCAQSNNAEDFAFPHTYTRPCSAANVISIATGQSVPPAGSPEASSPGQAIAPAVAPAVEVPVGSPDAEPYIVAFPRGGRIF